MDAGALATGLLLVTLREPAQDGGAPRMRALVALPEGSPAPATTFDGCDASPIGRTERAPVAWAIAFDPAYAAKERFRDGRQLALYFASHLGPGDRMNVIVLGPGAPNESGWHGVDELTLLRAPLDRTVDPLPRASAGDAVRTAASAVAVAPLTGLVRHAHVAIFEDGESTAVRIAAEGLDVRESFAAGQSQARGPRFVVEIGAQLASASRATWSLACPKTPGPAGPPAAREPDRTARTMWLLGAAIAGILATFGLVWRARRRG